MFYSQSRLALGEQDSALLFAVEAAKLGASAEVSRNLLGSLAANPHLVRYLEGHKSEIKSFSFGPNGDTFVSGSEDGRIVWWETGSGSKIDESTSTAPYLTGLDLNADGSVLVVASRDGELEFFQEQQEKQQAPEDYICRVVWSVRFVDNGNSLVTLCRNRIVKRKLGSTDVEDSDLDRNWGAVLPIAFSGNGAVAAGGGISIVTVQLDNLLQADAENPNTESYFVVPTDFHEYAQLALDFSGETLAIGDGQSFELWDLAPRKKRISRTLPSTEIISKLSLSGDGKLLIAGTSGGEIFVYRIRNKSVRLTKKLRGHNGRVTALSLGADGKTLLSGDEHGVILQWDLAKQFRFVEPFDLKMLQNVNRRNIRFTGTGESVFWLDESKQLWLWNSTLNTLESPLPNNPEQSINSLSFRPGTEVVAIGLADGRVQVHDLSGKGYQQYELQAHPTAVTWLEFSTDGEFFASQSCEKNQNVQVGVFVTRNVCTDAVRYWRALDGSEITKNDSLFAESTKSILVKDDWLLPINNKMDKSVLSTRSIQLPHPNNPFLITAGCGTTIAPCDRNTIDIWNLETGKKEGASLVVPGSVESMSISADGSILATSHHGEYSEIRVNNDVIILWDFDSRERLSTPLEGFQSINGLVLSSDGNRMLSMDSKRADIWKLDIDTLTSLACDTANRDISEKEWRVIAGDIPRTNCDTANNQ